MSKTFVYFICVYIKNHNEKNRTQSFDISESQHEIMYIISQLFLASMDTCIVFQNF